MPAILVVEDDASLRELLMDVLIEEGYRVRDAADGERALADIAEGVPDLVLADVRLPWGNVQAMRWCLASLVRPVPLVLMSGSPPPPGLDDLPFLRKPFDLDDLLTVVAASLPAWVHGNDAERTDGWNIDGLPATPAWTSEPDAYPAAVSALAAQRG